MKTKFSICISSLLLILCASTAKAGYFIGLTGAEINLDYQNVQIPPSTFSDVNGTQELLGFQAGYTTAAIGSVGTEISISFLGANAENLTPAPNWGIPWYYRGTLKANYTDSFGLSFFAGIDVMGTLYQRPPSHFFGFGVLAGLGYKFSEHTSLQFSALSTSVLFATAQEHRAIKGGFLELQYWF